MATNDIDLMYFTNSNARKMMDEKKKKKEKQKKIDKKDIKFYRKRILQLTKDLLRGGKSSNIINESFNAFIETAIKSFKFQDEAEILQKEFEDYWEKIQVSLDLIYLLIIFVCL